jgi:short-chain fatty acids transporter
LIATPGNEFIEAGVLEDTVSMTTTVLHPYALSLTILSIIFASAMLYLLAPSSERSRGITEFVPEEDLFESVSDGGDLNDDANTDTIDEELVPAERINNSKILGGIIALTAIVVVGYNLVFAGLEVLDINFVNFTVLFIGLAIYARPQVYRERFGEASEAAAGIILLFPFFAGIQGIIAESGLGTGIAEGMIAISTPETLPIVLWLSAAIVNLFAPSGGGEWIILGPSVIEAADQFGIPVGHATMAYAVGDAHTNLLNPFWAIPVLAITRIKAREMFGYGIAMLLLLIPFLAVVLVVVPY